jgi:hypothetical protein
MGTPLRTFAIKCRDLHIEVQTFLGHATTLLNAVEYSGLKTILDQIQKRFGDIEQEITEIRRNMSTVNSTVLRVAFQKVEITAAMLEASDDPTGTSVDRSVLTTASSTIYEFDWMLLRHYLIKLGGRGEPGHSLILDRDDRNIEIYKMGPVGTESVLPLTANVVRPYGVDGLKLQFGWWENKAGVFGFWPTSLAVGSWVYLEQVLPAVDMP